MADKDGPTPHWSRKNGACAVREGERKGGVIFLHNFIVQMTYILYIFVALSFYFAKVSRCAKKFIVCKISHNEQTHQVKSRKCGRSNNAYTGPESNGGTRNTRVTKKFTLGPDSV